MYMRCSPEKLPLNNIYQLKSDFPEEILININVTDNNN